MPLDLPVFSTSTIPSLVYLCSTLEMHALFLEHTNNFSEGAWLQSSLWLIGVLSSD